MSSPEDISGGPVIRDRRRIDPATGQVRHPDEPGQAGPVSAGTGPGQPAGGPAHPAGGPVTGQPDPGRAPAQGRHAASGQGAGAAQGSGARGTGPAAAEAGKIAVQLAERTADLQRLQAEYANYRKRVERDRVAVREQAAANVLAEILPVLDDIGRAREHGELSGGFKSVADSLESVVAKLGLTTYGEKGDPFDPVVHDALMHSYSSEVSVPTCVQILQPGYRLGDRILRPARVAVAEPGGEDTGGTEAGSPQQDAADGGD